MATTSLHDVLRQLGRRLVAVQVTAGVGWGLAAALLLLLTAVWLDLLWELPPTLRLIGTLSAGLAGLTLLVFSGWLAWRQRAPVALAQRLDRLAGTGGEIRSGVDLLVEPPATSDLSAGLAAMAVNQAGRLAGSVGRAQAIPARPIGVSFGSLCLLGAAVAIGCLAMPRLAWTQWLRFADPFGDHEPFSRIQFHVEPGDKQIVYGSGFDIRVTTEGAPVDRLDLVLQWQEVGGEEAVPMFPEPDGAWKATVANVTASGRYWVRTHGARSAKFRIQVITVPKIEDVRFRITPPAYTNRPPYEGPLPQGGLAGLPGTKVQVWAKSNRPLGGGTVNLTAGKSTAPLTMKAVSAGSQEATVTFEIRQAGKMDLRVTDADGQPSNDTFAAPIALLVDERPFVRLIEPKPMSFATPDVGLPVVISAEDDYGLSRIQLFRSLNDSRAVPVEVRVKTPPPTRWQEAMTLPLHTYGLTPGDEIKLFARAEDNDPAGPKGAESTVVVVRIVSREDYERMVRTQEGMETMLARYQEAERRLEAMAEQIDQLKEELSKSPPDSDLAKEQQAKLDQLSKEMQKQADAIRESAKHPLPYDLDKELAKHLEKLAKQMEDAAKDAEKMAGKSKPRAGSSVQDLKKLREKLAGAKKEFDQEAMEPLEHFAAVFPVLEDAAKFTMLYQRQRDLAERMQSLKGKDKVDDPAVKTRMRELQEEQQELREALAKLLDDIGDHVAKLPEDEKLDDLRKSATEFVQAVRDSGASDAMTDAETALNEFSGTRGQDAAKSAADIMEKFISKCKGMGEGACQCAGLKFQPSLSECVGNSIAQMLADMGLGMGDGSQPGFGTGSGGGYSSRRSSMDNVGIYGNLPRMTAASGSGSQRDNRKAMSGESAGGRTDNGQPSAMQAGGNRAAAGSAEAAVPSSYRRKVREYFQRVAEETGK